MPTSQKATVPSRLFPPSRYSISKRSRRNRLSSSKCCNKPASFCSFSAVLLLLVLHASEATSLAQTPKAAPVEKSKETGYVDKLIDRMTLNVHLAVSLQAFPSYRYQRFVVDLPGSSGDKRVYFTRHHLRPQDVTQVSVLVGLGIDLFKWGKAKKFRFGLDLPLGLSLGSTSNTSPGTSGKSTNFSFGLGVHLTWRPKATITLTPEQNGLLQIEKLADRGIQLAKDAHITALTIICQRDELLCSPKTKRALESYISDISKTKRIMHSCKKNPTRDFIAKCKRSTRYRNNHKSNCTKRTKKCDYTANKATIQRAQEKIEAIAIYDPPVDAAKAIQKARDAERDARAAENKLETQSKLTSEAAADANKAVLDTRLKASADEKLAFKKSLDKSLDAWALATKATKATKKARDSRLAVRQAQKALLGLKKKSSAANKAAHKAKTALNSNNAIPIHTRNKEWTSENKRLKALYLPLKSEHDRTKAEYKIAIGLLDNRRAVADADQAQDVKAASNAETSSRLAKQAAEHATRISAASKSALRSEMHSQAKTVAGHARAMLKAARTYYIALRTEIKARAAEKRARRLDRIHNHIKEVLDGRRQSLKYLATLIDERTINTKMNESLREFSKNLVSKASRLYGLSAIRSFIYTIRAYRESLDTVRIVVPPTGRGFIIGISLGLLIDKAGQQPTAEASKLITKSGDPILHPPETVLTMESSTRLMPYFSVILGF